MSSPDADAMLEHELEHASGPDPGLKKILWDWVVPKPHSRHRGTFYLTARYLNQL